MDDNEIRNPFIWVPFAAISKEAVELIGPVARMLYRSKSLKEPTTIFNANIYNSRADKIWFGDLEIERDRYELIMLAEKVGCIYILWEMDGGFLERKPSIEYVRKMAIVTVENGTISYSEEFNARVHTLIKRAAQKSGKNAFTQSPRVRMPGKPKKGEKEE